MREKLNPIVFGAAGAIVSAVIMLLLAILANLGIYTGAAEMMRQWHLFFSLSFGGIIMGMVEAAVISFVFLWFFAWLYNRLLRQ